jgi:beta-phosphoglucomutase-like phosphatase (HAD superfamily)
VYIEIWAMNESKAVLWDMDGTLVDSGELHWIAWRITMANEGTVIAHEQFLSTFGQCNDSIIPSWLGSAATAEQIERIAQAKEELYRHSVSRVGIAHEPGVARWLRRLHKRGWQQAMASAAPRANIERCWRPCQRATFFRALYRLKMYTGVNPIRRYTC